MNIDKYNEVINGKGTFKEIAKALTREKGNRSCIIGWTDGGYDHRDILFSYAPKILGGNLQRGGYLQRGLRWCRLYVSIMGFSSMGFLVECLTDNRKDNGYIMEKLNLHENHCDIEICNLINGVIHEIDIIEENIRE